MNEMEDQEIIDMFLEDTFHGLDEAEQCFLILEERPGDIVPIEKLFRIAHTVKGTSRAIGFTEIAAFTHELESLLLKLKNREIECGAGTVTLLLLCNDHLREWVNQLKTDVHAKMDCEELLREIRAVLSGEKNAVEGPNGLGADVSSHWPGAGTDQGAGSPKAAVTAQPLPQNVTIGDEAIRVSLKRLDTLMNNVGELVILQTVLHQQRFQIASPLIQRTISQLSKITKDIQYISMGLRMVQLKQTFQKMHRVMRDAAKTLGREIHFELIGEETELDKTMVDSLGDPLVHIVRNAVDHGIEPPEERLKAGKSREGKLTLSAFHQGGQMVIEIRDDGRGMDPEILRKKAIEKGLVHPDQALTRKEALELIFHPGFSTKTEVSEISGRGVGMDVVKTNVEQLLQGTVQIDTEIGRGSCFRLTLPLTMAIIEGMVVQAGDERYVIPMPHVHESVQPQKEEIHTVAGLGQVLQLRGDTLPLFRLADLLHQKSKANTDAIAIVFKNGKRPFAVLVDGIVCQQQVVIKKLGDELKNSKGISGGAILGDGRAALILEMLELVASGQSKVRNTSPRLAA